MFFVAVSDRCVENESSREKAARPAWETGGSPRENPERISEESAEPHQSPQRIPKPSWGGVSHVQATEARAQGHPVGLNLRTI